jgi:hypothetical protein
MWKAAEGSGSNLRLGMMLDRQYIDDRPTFASGVFTLLALLLRCAILWRALSSVPPRDSSRGLGAEAPFSSPHLRGRRVQLASHGLPKLFCFMLPNVYHPSSIEPSISQLQKTPFTNVSRET